MNVDQYFNFLYSLKQKNDICLLKKTIEANNNIFKVNIQDVNYLQKILKKLRTTPVKKQNEMAENHLFKKKDKPESHFLFINILNTVKRGSIFTTSSNQIDSPSKERQVFNFRGSKHFDNRPTLTAHGWETDLRKNGSFSSFFKQRTDVKQDEANLLHFNTERNIINEKDSSVDSTNSEWLRGRKTPKREGMRYIDSVAFHNNLKKDLLNSPKSKYGNQSIGSPKNANLKPRTGSKQAPLRKLKPFQVKNWKKHTDRYPNYKNDIVSPFKNTVNLDDYKYILHRDNIDGKVQQSLKLYKDEHFFTLNEGMVFGDVALEKQGSLRYNIDNII